MKTLALLLAFFSIQGFALTSQAACDQRSNPHSFECVHEAFVGRIFPLEIINWNTMQDEWFAVSYATPAGNSGRGFVMDVNPSRPSQPGRGVFNDDGSGQFSIMGSMWINGDTVRFDNWQGAPMSSIPGSLTALSDRMFQFDTRDQFGIIHRFQCTDFLRNQNHHLNCNWFILNRAQQWDFIGYFGWVTRSVWDQFVSHPH